MEQADPQTPPAEQPKEKAPSTYWADCDTTRIGHEIATKILECDQMALTSDARREILNAYQNFFGISLNGISPSASMVTRSGAQGERAEVRVNYSRSLASAKHQIVVGPKVSWACTASNGDYRSMADTVLGAKVLEVYWKERGIESRASEAVISAIWAGEEFIFTPWKESLGDEVMAVGDQVQKTGDVAYVSVPTWDVLRDPTAKSWDDLGWYIVRCWENKHDVAASHPAHAAEVLAVSSPIAALNAGGSNMFIESEFIPVYYFFHKRTPALPRGREAIVVGDTLLWESPTGLSYKNIPLHRMKIDDLKNTPWAYTSYWEILGIQDVTDNVTSSLTTHITTYSGGIISAEEGAELPEDKLVAGPTVLYREKGTSPPVSIIFPAAPKEAFTFKDGLKADQRQLMGLNDVSLGQPQTSDMNGTAFALLASMAVQANSTVQANYVAFVREIGRSTLQILQSRLTVERKIALAGVNSKGLVKQELFSGKSIQSVEDVIVEIGNPLQQTASGRYQIAQLNLEAGFVKNPEQMNMVLETGRLDPQTQAVRNQLLLVASENESMARGEEVPVSMYDNHPMHVPEHVALLADPDVRRDVNLVTLIQQHCAQHDQLWHTTPPDTLMLAGVSPPPPPMMPPPGAPLPPGGPPGPPGPPAQGPTPDMPEPGAGGVPLPGLPSDPTTGQPPPVNGVSPLSA